MAERQVKDGLDLALRGRREDWRNAALETEAGAWARLLAPLARAKSCTATCSGTSL